MSARLENLALEKQALLDRSALCRLRLRRDTHALRRSIVAKRTSMVVAVAAAPAVRALAWSLALSFLGVGRAARMVMIAGRVVLVAKLLRGAIGYARKSGKAAG